MCYLMKLHIIKRSKDLSTLANGDCVLDWSSRCVKLKFFSWNLSWVFYYRTKKATNTGEKILTPNVVIETFYHHHHFNHKVLSFQVYTKYSFCILHHTKNLRTLCKNGYCTILWRWYLIAPVVATFHYRLSGNQK